MNATLNILENPPLSVIAEETRKCEAPQKKAKTEWCPKSYAQQQLRGLLQQLFFSRRQAPVRQVVFSGVDRTSDVSPICRRVAKELAAQVPGRVCFVEANLHASVPDERSDDGSFHDSCQKWSRNELRKDWEQVSDNLWSVSVSELVENKQLTLSSASLRTLLTELRCEFQYAVVHAPPAGLYTEATLLGQVCDGVVLVLHAHQTRRAAARKVRNLLQAANVPLLGAVLDQRTFPIPELIYRRL